MKSYLAAITCCLFFFHSGTTQNLEWAINPTGTGDDACYGATIDNEGNVYTTGYFSSTVDFDPGSGVYELTAAGSEDVFVMKTNSNGELIWAVSMGGTESDHGRGVALDGTGGVYITGRFYGTADFNPEAGDSLFTADGGQGIFVVKLNTDGNFIWARHLEGPGNDCAWDITVDVFGDLVICGNFALTTDFDPDPTVTYNLISQGNGDAFITKWDSDGNFIWARSFGATSWDGTYKVTTDQSGNVYGVGDFYLNTNFDPGFSNFSIDAGTLVDGFIVKFDPSGNFIWAKAIGESGYYDTARDIKIDNLGNAYIIGSFKSTADLDPGAGIANFTTFGNEDVFVLKLDPLGEYVWAKQMGSTAYDRGFSLAIDALNNVYTTGLITGSADFDPNAGTYTLICNGSNDIFYSKLDSDGNLIWANRAGGASSDGGQRILVNDNQQVYSTGYFREANVDFDPESGIFPLSSTGGSDIFIQKLNQCDITVTTTTTDAICGSNNGSINTTITGGTPPFDMYWTSGHTTEDVSNLYANIYYFTLTDAYECEASASASVNSMGISLTADPTPTTCSDSENGAIDLTISTALTVESIVWSNGEETEDISNLQAGTYDVVVTTTDGCIATGSFTVNGPGQLLGTINTTSPSTCGGTDGQATCTVTGGTAPFTYQWFDVDPLMPLGNADSQNSLGVGSYFVLITDANNCQTTTTTQVSDLSGPILTLDVTPTYGCGDNGTITLSIDTVQTVVNTEWSTGSTDPYGISSLPTGTYFVTVTDILGCTSVASAEILNGASGIPTPICLVTVDTLTNTNLLVWEKPITTEISHYNIYRETSITGEYLFVDSVLYAEESVFNDTTASPHTRAWRYKITSVNTCGVESVFSDVHKTIHLVIYQGFGTDVILSWDHYEGFDYATFEIYRYTSITGWENIANLPATDFTYTDNPNSFDGIDYMVTISPPSICTSTTGKAQDYNSSRSNRTVAMPNNEWLQTSHSSENEIVGIYPNPSTGEFRIYLNQELNQNTFVKVFDAQGRLVAEFSTEEKAFVIDLSAFEDGIYHLQLETGDLIVNRKLVKQ